MRWLAVVGVVVSLASPSGAEERARRAFAFAPRGKPTALRWVLVYNK